MQERTVERRRRPVGALLLLTGALVALLSIALVACKSSSKSPSATATSQPQATPTALAFACAPAGSAGALTGAGSTFDNPLFTKWNAQYNTLCNVQINYQSIGSGGGITNITNKTVDYGASDAILNAAQTTAAQAAGGPILHIPVTMGGVAVIFNLPGIQTGQLKLTPDVLAKIYLGQITTWNDPAIAQANAGLTLPNTDITVVHRSDGSGTTFLFTDYLAKVNTDWQTKVGSGTTVSWPVGVGGDKSAGVAAQVQPLPGAIGYVEVTYAIQANLPWATIQNKTGKFVEPSLAAISAAAVGVTLPADMKVLIDNSDNPDAYPISGFSWVLAYVNQTDQAKGATLANYLWWGIHQGQGYSEALGYAKLPADAATKAEALIESLMYNSQPILQMH